jgi:1,2-phenylacetyl-CoA epoxidase PaaB subunit
MPGKNGGQKRMKSNTFFELREQVENWTPEEVIAWLRTQMKPEYQNEPINHPTDHSQDEYYCHDWLLAYRSGGTIWLWRGNGVLLDAVTEEEKNQWETVTITAKDGKPFSYPQRKPWKEYYTFPDMEA